MSAATPAQPAPVSPDLECTACAPGVTSPHGVPVGALEAAAAAIMTAQNANDDGPERWEAAHLAKVALEAALPLLAAQEPHAAPELAAAMAETRQLRERLAKLASEQDRDASADEKARDRQGDGVARLLLARHADLRRQFATRVREIAGPPS